MFFELPLLWLSLIPLTHNLCKEHCFSFDFLFAYVVFDVLIIVCNHNCSCNQGCFYGPIAIVMQFPMISRICHGNCNLKRWSNLLQCILDCNLFRHSRWYTCGCALVFILMQDFVRSLSLVSTLLYFGMISKQVLVAVWSIISGFYFPFLFCCWMIAQFLVLFWFILEIRMTA